MDFQLTCLLTAIAGLATGALLCWLVLRGRIAAAARTESTARNAARADLAKVQKRAGLLDEERHLASANFDKLKAQSELLRDALDEALAGQSQLKAHSAAQAQAFEARLLTLQDKEKADQQELRTLTTRYAASAEALKRVSARLVELEAQDAALKAELSAAHARQAAATQVESLAVPLQQTTQLPVLETEVLALQSLAETIQQDFLALLEAQRNFTAASSALQDVS